MKSVDDAMVLLQESLSTIVDTTNRISTHESTKYNVVAAMNTISDRMEAKVQECKECRVLTGKEPK